MHNNLGVGQFKCGLGNAKFEDEEIRIGEMGRVKKDGGIRS